MGDVLRIVIIVAVVLVVLFILIMMLSGGMRQKDYFNESGWERKKRKLFFGLPWGFTFYSETNGRLYIKSGFLSKHEDEIQLYRIRDIDLTEGFMQRIFGLGTVSLVTSDKTAGNIRLTNIKDAKKIKDRLSADVETERDRKRVGTRELVGDMDDDADGDI